MTRLVLKLGERNKCWPNYPQPYSIHTQQLISQELLTLKKTPQQNWDGIFCFPSSSSETHLKLNVFLLLLLLLLPRRNLHTLSPESLLLPLKPIWNPTLNVIMINLSKTQAWSLFSENQKWLFNIKDPRSSSFKSKIQNSSNKFW